MLSFMGRLRIEEKGQSLVEYTLVVAFIMFTIVGLARGYHASIGGVTSMTNSNLATANSVIP
jgi:Flp pilus assembly pilin Flp